MLPEVRLGRYCCAPSTHPDNYRPLVGDALIDEIQGLARELQGVLVGSDTEELQASLASGQTPLAFEMAGPRTQPASMAGAPTD